VTRESVVSLIDIRDREALAPRRDRTVVLESRAGLLVQIAGGLRKVTIRASALRASESHGRRHGVHQGVSSSRATPRSRHLPSPAQPGPLTSLSATSIVS
jgi:hypothetical protein